MTVLAAATIALLSVGAPAQSGDRVTEEQKIIRHAMAARDCRGTEGISLRLGFSLEELMYTEACWASAQRPIMARAMREKDCPAVESLPGLYPLGSDNEKRFVYHCWMDSGIRDLDTCIGMIEVGNKSSIPRIVKVLAHNPPIRLDGSQQLAIIDTAGACMSAFGRIKGLSEGEVRKAAAAWGKAWSEWASQP